MSRPNTAVAFPQTQVNAVQQKINEAKAMLPELVPVSLADRRGLQAIFTGSAEIAPLK